MPTFGQIKLKLDSANTGPFLATVKRTIGGTANGNIHPFCVMDPDNDVIAAVLTTAPGSSTAGAVVRPVNAGGTNALNIQDGGNVISVDGPLTDAELRATAVPVSGTFWQATQPVSGTFWQATQPVSGPLTDAELRATAVPVSGTFWQATQPVSGTFWQATQPVSGTVNAVINNFPSTYPVTGTFWQATQPVNGTVSANILNFPSLVVVGGSQSGVPLLTDISGALAIQDNGNAITVDGDVNALVTSVSKGTSSGEGVTSTAEGDDHQALDVQIYHGAQAIDPSHVTIINGSGSNAVYIQGSVEITNFAPGSNAASLGKAEDSPHTSGDIGVFCLSVRQDSLAGSTSNDGDYQAIKTDALGRMYVIAAGTVAVSNFPSSFSVSNFPTTIIPVGSDAQGAESYVRISDASENALVIKNSPGSVSLVIVGNWASDGGALLLYNQTTTPTVTNTANLKAIVPMPGNADVAGGPVPIALNLKFSVGIAMRMVLGKPTSTTNTVSENMAVTVGYY